MPFSTAKEKYAPAQENSFKLRFWEPFALVVMVLLIATIYSNTVHGPFVFDDIPTIQESPTIQITKLTLGGLLRAATEHYYSNRPLANLTIALNYYFGQEDPLFYHVFNIIIHVLTAIVLYFLIKNILILVFQSTQNGGVANSPVSQASDHQSRLMRNIFLISYFSASIWAIHPVNSQAVNYIVQRMTTLSALFYILSLYLFIRGRCHEKNKWKLTYFGGCCVSALLALASKENAATLPLTLFLFEWIFFQAADFKWLRRKLPYLLGTVIIVGIIGFIYLDGHPFEKIMSKYSYRDFSMTQRLLTELRVVVYYISLILYPHPGRLNIDYDFPISKSLVDPISTLISLCIIAGLLAISFIALRKQPLFSFCILWFFINLLIESSIIGLEIIFEHRTYLPSMFVIAIPVSMLICSTKFRKLSIPILLLVIISCAVFTQQRNRFWTDDEILWKDAASKSPDKARPVNNLGFAIAKKGRYDEAIPYYQSALQIDPTFTSAYVNLGAAQFEKKRYSEAVASLKKALELNPDYVMAGVNLGTIYMELGMTEEAILTYSRVLDLNPYFPVVHNNLGYLLAKKNKTSEALEHYQKSLELNPNYSKAYNNIANLMLRTGQYKRAVENYQKALTLEPNSAKANNNLGVAYMYSAQPEKAIEQFQIAVRLDPNYQNAKDNLKKAKAEVPNF